MIYKRKTIEMKYVRSALLLIAALFVSHVAVAQDAAVGVVERQEGEATRINAGGTTALEPGSEIFVDDVLVTGEGARLLVTFVDDSTLTLGADARIIVDDLVYDTDATDSGAQTQVLDIVQGVFRYVSGDIAKDDTDQVVINTPVATIGIRGTEFVGGELTVGMPAGRPHYGFQVAVGAIDIIAPGGTVTLDEPGEGTFLPLTRIAAPTEPRQWTHEEAQEAIDALAF